MRVPDDQVVCVGCFVGLDFFGQVVDEDEEEGATERRPLRYSFFLVYGVMTVGCSL